MIYKLLVSIFVIPGVILTTCGTDPDAQPGGPLEALQSSSHQSLRVPFVGPGIGIDPAFTLCPSSNQMGSRLFLSGAAPGVAPPGSGSLFSSQISRSTGTSGEYSLFGSTPTTTSGPWSPLSDYRRSSRGIITGLRRQSLYFIFENGQNNQQSQQPNQSNLQ